MTSLAKLRKETLAMIFSPRDPPAKFFLPAEQKPRRLGFCRVFYSVTLGGKKAERGKVERCVWGVVFSSLEFFFYRWRPKAWFSFGQKSFFFFFFFSGTSRGGLPDPRSPSASSWVNAIRVPWSSMPRKAPSCRRPKGEAVALFICLVAFDDRFNGNGF